MTKKYLIIIGILAGFLSCKNSVKIPDHQASDPGFIRVSRASPRYFETTGGNPWIPVMINYIMPGGEESKVFHLTENFLKHFSENGGNAVRIWISSPFLEIEDGKAGEYDAVKFSRIDHLLELAGKYHIRVKFTLQHIRSIGTTGSARQPWANSEVLFTGNGGPFSNIGEYINSPEGRNSYLNRVRALAERYRHDPRIFSWELWNEMDAVDENDWFPFTTAILDSVKALFPDHLVAQTLGSLHSVAADERYEKFLTISNNPYIPVHRYLDPGNAWGQYDIIHGPVDLFISDAIRFVYRPEFQKPVVANEHGAVEPNHAGPNRYYETDTAGVFIHDMIFAPFFCGASGCGSMWHWDSYVEKQDLWYHYRRFNRAIEGIDPVHEAFEPFRFEQDSVRCYGIRGKKTSMIWCRDATNNWITELQQEISAGTQEGFCLPGQYYRQG